MSLPGRLVERLEAALLDAFPDDDALDALLKRVGMQAKVPSRAPLATRVGKLVELVDAHGDALDLLDAALRLVPGNAALAQVHPLILDETATRRAPLSMFSTRDPATPTPAYPDADVQARAERLRAARARQKVLRDAGQPADEVDREVLQLRRELREGGQLRAGDDVGDGRYLLIQQVGRGGFAVVWKAHDTIEKINVAVKVLHSNLAGDLLRRERFFRGAKVMMKLAHPGVVRVLEPMGEDGGFCYFVMELMPGGNLREAVLQKRVAKANVLPVIVQVGEALAKAHANRVIHRDVKPSNIVLDEHGHAKLTDFDLVGAHDTTGGTRTGALGTVVYAAPECLDRPQDATARADVYGLGMTAIFCLLGQELTLSTFRNPEPTIARLDCSPGVRKVLERAVAWEPDQRFKDADAMLDALRGALAADRLETHGVRTAHRVDVAHAPQPKLREGNSGGGSFAVLRFISGKYLGGEFPLRRNTEITIGRSGDADMVLAENMISLHHAKIGSTETEIYIEDMASIAGTFVNGERIAGRVQLHEDDRIALGTSIIKVEATSTPAMSGVIEEIPLANLLRLLSARRKTGVLTLNNGVSTGKIYLRNGGLYFATIDQDSTVNPQKSIYRLLSWTTGAFELESGVELEVTEELQQPTEVLLTEGLQQIEELRDVARQLPAPSSPLGVPTPLCGKLRELTPLELDIFQLALEHGVLQKVLDNFPGTDLEAATHLASLMRREFVIDPRDTQSSSLPPPPEILESTRLLAIERLQQLDEFRNLRTQLPPLGSALAVPIPLAGPLRALSPSELDTFQGVLDHGEVRKVLSGSPESALDMARSLVRLMRSEFIVVP